MRTGLVGSLAFDASVILELLYSTPQGSKLKEALKNETVHGNISELCVAEAGYVLRRKLGGEEARVRIRSLLESGYIFVHEDSELVEYATEYERKRNLSPADCFIPALAKKINAPAFFP